MELRHLRYFAAVAEERHFGRAARRLHMAQPPLSRQIQALEAELGFELFERTRRRVELTAAGDVLLERARRVFEELDRAVGDARRASEGESGRVLIGYVSSLAYAGIAPFLRDFRRRWPDVELGLRELPPQTQIESLKDGRIDVGFLRAPVDDPGLSRRVVRRERLMIALPGGHPLARHKRLELASLAHEPFVLFPRPRGPAFFDHLIALCRAAGFSPRIAQEAPQLDLVSLVAAGFGVAILPESLRVLGRRQVALRPIVGDPMTELLAVWRTSDRSPAVARFLEAIGKKGMGAKRGRVTATATTPAAG
jgi:DNA-binding transcriptional LysR family regulator